jgi:hypothetical protein
MPETRQASESKLSVDKSCYLCAGIVIERYSWQQLEPQRALLAGNERLRFR